MRANSDLGCGRFAASPLGRGKVRGISMTAIAVSGRIESSVNVLTAVKIDLAVGQNGIRMAKITTCGFHVRGRRWKSVTAVALDLGLINFSPHRGFRGST